ncbi:MAG: hypothetical protein EON52_08930 [Actinomycetales bacterium]|nr:MAG: hypothetical protein EON52_08930 [Actinomycetales bacterium]
MIHFYASGRHTYTFSRFVKRWAPQLAEQSTVRAYSQIDLSRAVEPGLHVLTDFERLLGPERRFVQRLHRLLSSRPETHAVLGDVGAWLDRHSLLVELHRRGLNDFRSYRLDEMGPDVTYPVFLRWANEHGASLGEPAADRAELDERVAQHVGRRRHLLRRHLIAVEQVDARSPDGLFRKYSAMRIGDAVVPRHVLFSDQWITKNPDLASEALAREERAFVDTFHDDEPFPHAARVREVFDIAGMDYGRIDYSVLDGRMRVWEINSNPVIGATGLHPTRHASQRRSADAVTEALLALVPPPAPTGAAALHWPRPGRWAWAGVAAASRRYDPHRR